MVLQLACDIRPCEVMEASMKTVEENSGHCRHAQFITLVSIRLTPFITKTRTISYNLEI
jgi:hypothetical protein